MTEREIQIALRRRLWPKPCFPNVYVLIGEQDVLAMTKARYAYEYEVKTSLSDFRADFKKLGWGGYTKHDVLAAIEVPPPIHLPRQFWFVCPEGVIPEKEVPEHAGLLHARVTPSGHPGWKVIKKAPTISRALKLDADTCLRLASKISYRWWDLLEGMDRAAKAKEASDV